MAQGRSPKSMLITWRSCSSIDCTDSMMQCTCAQANCLATNFRMRLTCLKSLLRWSRKAPRLSTFKPLTPWQGGPAPIITSPTWVNWHAHSFTVSAVTRLTSSTKTVLGNRDSSTLEASLLISMLTCPATGSPAASAATRRAPMPSKIPIVKTWVISSTSATSPLTGQEAAIWPMLLRLRLTVTPPPVDEASLAVTFSSGIARKSMRASGNSMRKRKISTFTNSGISSRMTAG